MEYKPLDYDTYEFRILTILADEAEDLKDPVIQCSINHECLLEPPEYHALSYCWGDKRDTKPIHIDGNNVQVTANLEAALWELKAKGYTTLWVDALCIDQENKTERGLQVQRMHLIFSMASTVVAWLGADCDGAGLAFEALRDSWNRGPRRYDPVDADSAFIDCGTPETSMLPLEIAGTAFEELFRRPFWRRVWIIQEIAKAKELVLLIGNRQITWPQFEQIFSAHRSSTPGEPRKPIKDIPPEVKALQEFRQGEQEHSAPDLLAAMRKTIHFESSDVRDKIYALLGLSSDGAIVCPTPNYVQSPRTVYFHVVKAFLSRNPSLSAPSKFLTAPNTLHRISNNIADVDWTNLDNGVPGEMFALLGVTEPLPIWGLTEKRNWISLENVCPMNGCSGDNDGLEHEIDDETHWRFPCSRLRKNYPLPQRRLTPSGLLSKGYIVDSIGTFTTPLNLSERLREQRNYHEGWRKTISGHLTAKAKSIRSLSTADVSSYESTFSVALMDFWDALVAGKFYSYCVLHHQYTADATHFDHIRAAYALTNLCLRSKWELNSNPHTKEDEFINWLVTNHHFAVRGRSLRESVEGYSKTESYQKGLRGKHTWSKERYLDELVRHPVEEDHLDLLLSLPVASRSYMRLASGLHEPVLGFVGPAAREGDLICKLSGTRAPIIVRREGQVYRFVCEARLTVNPFASTLWQERQQERLNQPEQNALASDPQERPNWVQEVLASSNAIGHLTRKMSADANWRVYEQLRRGGKPRNEFWEWMVIQ